jgi:Peptidyl-tRNA hydrolase PTH2
MVHASRLSLLSFVKTHPYMDDEFLSRNSCGNTGVLSGRHERDLLATSDKAGEAGLPWALFSDYGHVMLPYFDGPLTLTSLAIAPVSRECIRPIVKKFQCVKGACHEWVFSENILKCSYTINRKEINHE